MKATRILATASFVLALATSAFAQSDRGTITGTVVDPDGGVVPGASVVAENPENGARYETVTTQTGNYTLAQVPVGTYHLNVELAGFGRFRQEGIRIFVGQTARIDAKLQLGNLAEEVNVVADASMLDTQSAEIASSVTSENLNSLPLNFGARGNFAAAGDSQSVFVRDARAGRQHLELQLTQGRRRAVEHLPDPRRRDGSEQPSADDSHRSGAALGGVARGDDGAHEQLRRRVRAGGGRHLQPDRQIGHEHVSAGACSSTT